MDSSFDDGELIKELGDLGMIYAENMKDEKKEKPKTKAATSSKKDTPRSGKRRPPSKLSINLDELMDGIETKPPNFSTSTSTKPTTSAFPINSSSTNLYAAKKQEQQKNDSIEALESRLNSYFAMQIRTLINEFSVEIDKMFQDKNEIDPIVNKFIIDLRQQIRDSCNFDGAVPNLPSPSFLFDTFSIGFSETFKEANDLQSYKPQEEIKRIRQAKSKFIPFPALVRQTFNTAVSDITSIVSDRNVFAMQKPFIDSDYNCYEKYRELSLMRYELECRAELQDEESKMLQNKIEKLEDERSRFSESLEHSANDSIFSDIDSQIKEKIAKLNVAINKMKRRSLFVTENSVKSMIDDNSSMVQMRDMTFKQFASFVEESKTSSQIQQTIDRDVSRVREEKPSLIYQAQALQANTDTSFNATNVGSDQSTVQLLNKVRNKLKEVQAQRESELQNVTTFLSTMKRREKKRRRQQQYGDDSIL